MPVINYPDPRNLGVKLSPKDKRDLKMAQISMPVAEVSLPTCVFNPVKITNQYHIGACTGYGMSTIVSGLSYFENQKFTKFSGRWIYAWNKYYDGHPNTEGSYSRLSFKTVQKLGVTDTWK